MLTGTYFLGLKACMAEILRRAWNENTRERCYLECTSRYNRCMNYAYDIPEEEELCELRRKSCNSNCKSSIWPQE